MQETSTFERIIFTLLLMLIGLTAVPYGTVEAWWNSALFICILVIFCSWSLYDGFRGTWNWRGRQITLPLFLLALFAYFQSLPILSGSDSAGNRQAISFDREGSWLFAVELACLAIFMELLWRFVSTKQRLKYLVNTVLGVAALSSIFGIIRELIFSRSAEFVLSGLKAGAGFAQFINRNHFALLILMAAGLAFGFIVGQKSRQLKVFYLGILIVMAAGLALSVSRGGVLAFVGQILFVFFLYLSGMFKDKSARKQKSSARRRIGEIAWKSALGVILFSVILVGVIWLGGDRMAQRFEQMPQEVETQEVGSSRKNLWSASLLLVKDYPVAGVGFGGYKYAISRHFQYSGRVWFEQAHNDYIELLASGGIIGAILALWFLIAVTNKGRRELDRASDETRFIKLGALVGLVGVGIHSFVDFGLHTTINALISVTLTAIFTGHFDERRKRSKKKRRTKHSSDESSSSQIQSVELD